MRSRVSGQNRASVSCWIRRRWERTGDACVHPAILFERDGILSGDRKSYACSVKERINTIMDSTMSR